MKIEQAFGPLKRRFRGLLAGLRVSPESYSQCFGRFNAKDRNQPDFDYESEETVHKQRRQTPRQNRMCVHAIPLVSTRAPEKG